MTAINFSNALGSHPDYLEYRVARAEVLASNIANADTPGYKSRDLKFVGSSKAVSFSNIVDGQLKMQESRGGLAAGDFTAASTSLGSTSSVTHPKHFVLSIDDARSLAGNSRFETHDRSIGHQLSLDGNSVDVQKESAEFARNALDFSVSFRLLNGRFSGLSKAISGQ